MNELTPLVSIGLPVFNGAQYLAEVLDSLLGQTYTNFELIISDNASTDETQEICQAYAAKDPRVCYYRNRENIGAVQNWYRTFDLSRGEYFTSAGHDDRYAPEFLSACVAVLDRNPDVVLCYTRTKIIDEDGNVVRNFEVEIDTTSPKPHVRLYNVIGIDYLCIQLFGLVRASAFGKADVYVGYYGCDRNTLAELALMGQIYEIPDYLFFHRFHAKALGAARRSGRTLQELLAWDPGTNWRLRFPTLHRFWNYLAAISKTPLPPSERLLCYVQLVRLVVEKSLHRIGRLNIVAMRGKQP